MLAAIYQTAIILDGEGHADQEVYERAETIMRDLSTFFSLASERNPWGASIQSRINLNLSLIPPARAEQKSKAMEQHIATISKALEEDIKRSIDQRPDPSAWDSGCGETMRSSVPDKM